MNIEFQTAGLLLSLLLFILYVTQKRLGLYSEKIFFSMLVVSILLLIADIGSVAAIVSRGRLPAGFVHAVCKLYIFLLALEAGMAALYILVDVADGLRYRIVLRVACAAAVIQGLTVFLLPVFIFQESRAVYTFGPCATAGYLFGGFYLLLAVLVLFFARRQIYPRRRLAFSIWMFLWVCAVILQFRNSRLLVVGFSVALGMAILYILLENPEGDLNPEYGCFNALALEKYGASLSRRRKKICFAFVLFDPVLESTGLGIRALLEKCRPRRKILVFRVMDFDFLLLTEDAAEFEALLQWMRNEIDGVLSGSFVSYFCNGKSWTPGSVRLQDILEALPYYKTKIKEKGGQKITELPADMLEEYTLRKRMVAEIRDALNENRVEVFFQPIHALPSRQVVSAEALVRIRARDGSLIPPSHFIPVAESTGSIGEIGERVLDETCRFLSESGVLSSGLHHIEVNLSVVQCEREDLAARLSAIFRRRNTAPQTVNLEITETGTVHTKQTLLRNMRALIAEGCTFSLDDFGKGESNLMYLVEMPVSIVKMDYDLTKAFFHEEKARRVVTAVVRLAHELGLSVVAEGIEEEEELQAMENLGVDFIQGYYFSRPLPEAEFFAYVQEHTVKKENT